MREAVFDLDLNSAAGPDGYTGRFFQSSWEDISMDILPAVKEFFRLGKITPGLNSSVAGLIPKEKWSIKMGDFRPIVVNNFLFKIFTKVLSSKLNAVSPSMTSQNKFSFIHNRHIHDAIAMASEGVNCLGHSTKAENLSFKVDIKKAFDTL